MSAAARVIELSALKTLGREEVQTSCSSHEGKVRRNKCGYSVNA